jgi:hypothetical protein
MKEMAGFHIPLTHGVPNIVPDYEIARNTCREAPNAALTLPRLFQRPPKQW